MPDEAALVESLFTLIENVIFYGERTQGGEMVTMMHPGQFISLNLKMGNANDEFVMFDVTNDCLDTSFIRSPLTSTILGQYQKILQFKALPYKELTAQQKQELAQDKQILSHLYAAYDQYRQAALKARNDYQAALLNPNGDPIQLQQLQDAYQRAQQQWDTSGNRQAYENAYADAIYLQSGDPRTYFQDLTSRLNNSGPRPSHWGNYFSVTFEPAISEWANASWTHTVLDTSTVTSSSYNRSTSWSGGISAGWGLWSFGGSGGHSETYHHDHSAVTTLVADIEYLRVRIVRPWMESDIFTDRFWTWLKTVGFSYISDGGNISANTRPIGTMPFLPSEMVVVRNVKLTADFTETDNQIITTHNQGGASFGWGPFSISGSYTEDTSQVNTSAIKNGATIEIAQPQIIGFMGALLPTCPNPDPSLPWQGDAVFPQGMRADEAHRIREIRAHDYERRANQSARRKEAKQKPTAVGRSK